MNLQPGATLDEEILNRWIGNIREHRDTIDLRQANLLRATLEPDQADFKTGDQLPDGWHWVYFAEPVNINELGQDGHAARGGFLPPVALPKRMWAGVRLKFHQPIIIGEEVVKKSEVKRITRKTGRSGELCFVTVNHKIYSGSTLKLEEDHDIVYRGTTPSRDMKIALPAAPGHSDCQITINPSPILLFRYSALTFNSHRIHYDLDYCRNVEGYPGLVLHAPLVVNLMLGLARSRFSGRNVTFSEFNQESIYPLYHDNPFVLHFKMEPGHCQIWATNSDQRLAARATLTVSQECAPENR